MIHITTVPSQNSITLTLIISSKMLLIWIIKLIEFWLHKIKESFRKLSYLTFVLRWISLYEFMLIIATVNVDCNCFPLFYFCSKVTWRFVLINEELKFNNISSKLCDIDNRISWNGTPFSFYIIPIYNIYFINRDFYNLEWRKCYIYSIENGIYIISYNLLNINEFQFQNLVFFRII